MKKGTGRPVFSGVAIGRAYIYKKQQAALPASCGDAAVEQRHFEQAKEEAREQLQALFEKTCREIGEEQGMIIDVQMMMLDDLDYIESIEAMIKNGASAAEAVKETGDTFAAAFSAMDDDYMKARAVDVKDSFASRVAALKGFTMAVISGGDTPALSSRCQHMGVSEENLYLGVRGKLATFRKFCEKHGFDPSEVAYFGDDIPDIQVLRACGFGVAPSDAAQEAKEAADYVTLRPGGRGCLREGIELIMKAQGKWQFDEDKFHQIY